jgi:hypothetical protein
LDWIADTAQRGSYASLRGLPHVVLRRSAEITVHNQTDTLAFVNRVRVWQPDLQTLVAPVFLSDNYFAVLPGEQITVALQFCAAPMVQPPTVTLAGWSTGLGTPGM